MNWRWINLFFSLLLLMQACAPIPDHETARISESIHFGTTLGAARESGDFNIGEWPRECWWEDFRDPILTKLIEAALDLSPTLKKAEARLKGAAQFALQKRAKLFPEVDFTPSDNWQHLSRNGFFREFAPTIPAVVNDVIIALSFSYEFDFWGKNRDLFNAALGQAAALAAEKNQVELILSTSIAFTYFELQFLLCKQFVLHQIEENTQAISDLRHLRARHALDPSIPVLDSQFNTLDIQTQLVAVDQQIQQHLHKLKALSGLGQDEFLNIEYQPLESVIVTLPETLSLDLISRRPDLIAQKARVEAASKEISAAKTDFYPDVNLVALAGFESVVWSKLFTKRDYSGSFNPAIHLPIFTAGRLKAQLMEKVENFNEAVFGYNELILQTAQEVCDNLSDLLLLQDQIELRKRALKTTREEAELTLWRVQHALDDQLTLLSAENAVLQSKLSLAALEYGKQLSGILLIRSLGGGLSAP